MTIYPVKKPGPKAPKARVKLKRGRLKASNPQRKKRLFEENFGGEAYLAFIHSLPCDVCGVKGFTVAAHLRSRGAGGKAEDLAPLCRTRFTHFRFVNRRAQAGPIGCHERYDAHDPEMRKHEARLKTLAAQRRAAWLNSQKMEKAG